MNRADAERVRRYRKAFPADTRSAEEIVKELDERRSSKKKMDSWVERNVFQRKEAQP